MSYAWLSPWTGGGGNKDFPYSEYLLQNPEAVYFAQRGRFNYPNAYESPRRRRYYENAFQDVYNQYKGEVGIAAMGGRSPEDLTFEDWLQNNYSFSKHWQSLAPQMRGEQSAQFAPSLRWFT